MKVNINIIIKILMIFAIFLLIIFTNLPTYAISMEQFYDNSTKITTGFNEVNNDFSSFEIIKNNISLKIFLGILIVYLIFQVITIFKYKQIKQIIYNNLIVLLILLIMYLINTISAVFMDENDLIILIEDYLLIYYIYSVILVVSLIIQIVHLKQRKLKKNLDKRLIIVSIINIVIISIYILTPKVQITTRDWSFGRTLGSEQHERIMLNNKKYLDFKIINKDKDGVLVEYDLINYSYDSEKQQQITEKETIQEKLKWNKTYIYDRYAEDLMLCVDGGTDYYIKFKR